MVWSVGRDAVGLIGGPLRFPVRFRALVEVKAGALLLWRSKLIGFFTPAIMTSYILS